MANIYGTHHRLSYAEELIYLVEYKQNTRHADGGAVGLGTELQAGRSRVRFPMLSVEFFIVIILPAALWSWGRLSL